MARKTSELAPSRFRPGDKMRVEHGMHPIDTKRCERDGPEWELMLLGEEDLELGDGTPVAIEQPTSIVTKPLTIQRPLAPKESDLDDEGLLCEARTRRGPFDIPLSEVERGGENRRLVEDYGYWSHNWR